VPLLKFNLLRADKAAESIEEYYSFNNKLAEPDELENTLEELQSRLSELEEPRLIELAIRARHLEWCAFVLRGMCASELRRRYSLRLAGGRGKRDRAGEGIQAQMTRLAENIGVSPTTLMTDARISDTFFSSIEDTTLAREHTLAREFYVIALSAPVPHEAIKVAAQHAHTGGYTRERFRDYVRDLKESSQSRSQGTGIQPSDLAHVRVPRTVKKALEEISRLSGKSEADELTAMILARYKALRQPNGKMGEAHDVNVLEDSSPLQLTLTI
jgi:polyhydroxyalkanoate synthesis regulator phasin